MAIEPSTQRLPCSWPLDTVELFDLPFVSLADEEAASERLLEWPHSVAAVGAPLPIVITPNVDIVVQLHDDESAATRRIATSCAAVLPDGAPIVWVSRLVGRPLGGRLAGSSVFEHWWPQAIEGGRRIAVLCSSDLVLQGLEREYPDATYSVAPVIDTSGQAIEDVAEEFAKRALAIGAEFCVLGLGHPKDSLIAEAVLRLWPADRPQPLILCLGGSAELYLGLRKRAPKWAQRWGLEWMVRFLQEPRRMFHRYFVRDLRFLPLVVAEMRKPRA
jgi:N-acetylglucosaminyldiphosphoundecaprenol N-acetyl-beta-D-mannosaminyltransferase